MRKLYIVLLIICASSLLTVYAQGTSSGYKVVKKIHLDGDGKWDYLFSDDASGRLYVSHGDRIHIIDESKGTELGAITGLEGVHGIAIAPDFAKGFISTKNDNMVIIFDTKSFKVIEKVNAEGKSPDAILFDPYSKKVFVCNGHSNNATVIDPATDKIVATIAFSGNPEFSATDGKGKIYINLEDAGKIVVVNAVTYKVENEWSLAPGKEPTGLALDNENHLLFSVCANNLMVVMNAESGKVVTTLPIGNKPDGCGFDPGLKRAFSSNGEGTMTIVQESAGGKFTVLENFPTQKGAKTMTVNKLTHHVYTTSADFQTPKEGGKPSPVPGSFTVLDIAPQL